MGIGCKSLFGAQITQVFNFCQYPMNNGDSVLELGFRVGENRGNFGNWDLGWGKNRGNCWEPGLMEQLFVLLLPK